MMKKALVVLIIAALSLSMLAVFSGCGTDQNKENAKKLMESGDTYMSEAQNQAKAIGDKQNEVASGIIQGDLSILEDEAGAATKQEFEDMYGELSKSLKSATDEYRGITELEDVQDYKDYADKMVEAIIKYEEWLAMVESLTESIATMVENLEPGQQPDLTTLMQMPEVQEVTRLQEEAEGLVKEAELIKKDRKLAD